MASASDSPVCSPAGAGQICLQAPGQSAATAHAAAKSVLSSSQFGSAGGSNWIYSFLNWVGRGLSDVAGWFFSGNGLSIAGLVVAGLLVVLALVLAARFAVRVQSDPAVRVHEDQVGRTPVDWRAEADRHAAAGDWRQALRCQYRALVAELAERGVVEEMPGRTAREYEQQVRASAPAAAASFEEASDMFEAVWYGFAPCGADDLAHFAAASTATVRAARSKVGRAA